jgi:hypothetical protein
MQAAGLLEDADSLLSSSLEPHCQPISGQSPHTLWNIVEHIQKLKDWGDKIQISLINGPSTLSIRATGLALQRSMDRAALRGYPSKRPNQILPSFETIHSARLMHLYWTVLLTLHMTILENPVLRAALDAERNFSSYMTEFILENDARQLADSIALYSDFCCQNLWQSYGPLVSIFSLETAIRWYENHETSRWPSGGDHESDWPGYKPYLDHCHDLLRNIRAGSQEAKDMEIFQNATFEHVDVLHHRWC